MKNTFRKFCLAGLMALTGVQPSLSADGVGLTFTRTGTDAADVVVNVVDSEGQSIAGATATVSSNQAFKATGNAVTPEILCPNVNANTSPNIVLTFEVSGLPAECKFNTVGLNIHALNGGGNYQENGDGVVRQWNVQVQQGKTAGALQSFANYSDIDIAAGVGTPGAVHKVWNATSETVVTAGNTLVVQLTITKGTANSGCFFGLSGITLTNDGNTDPAPEPEPEPEPDPSPNPGESNHQCYTIKWKNNTSSYIAEEADGSLVVKDYDVAQRIFWEFIPTGKDNCYYIRNTATGRYISSCNLTPSSASKIKTGTAPVEYYVGATAATSGEIKGCHWFSSTDCSGYDDEAAGPRALNKDGASSSIITWQAGTSRVGSYWTLTATEDLYEVRPFAASAALGAPQFKYAVVSAQHPTQALQMAEDGTLSWQPKQDAEAQAWYFVGEGNNAGGYLIANAKSHRTLSLPGEEATRWNVLTANTEDLAYYFRPHASAKHEGTALVVSGDSLVQFKALRSDFARRNQVYELPCGTLGNRFVARATIDGESVVRPMAYPLPKKSGTSVVASSATTPTSWYTLYTSDKASLARGTAFDLMVQLNSAPITGQAVYVYADWNRDGVFETMEQLPIKTKMTATLQVPEEAVAGKTRLRVRLTSNGLTDAEDEVVGQILDFVVEVVENVPETFEVKVETNDPTRGTATVSSEAGTTTVAAKALGNAAFVCWKEGNKLVSVKSEYAFQPTHSATLTAYFSPNTDETEVGIPGAPVAENNLLVEVVAGHKQIAVNTSAKVLRLLVFTAEGSLVAQSHTNVVDVAHLPVGAYIVKVVTDVADTAAKVMVK